MKVFEPFSCIPFWYANVLHFVPIFFFNFYGFHIVVQGLGIRGHEPLVTSKAHVIFSFCWSYLECRKWNDLKDEGGVSVGRMA